MSNVSDRDAQPRRQHQLADGRRSRGYIPVEDELLETPISDSAFRLLVHLRQHAIERETDGFIEERALATAAGFMSLKPARLRALLQELQTAGLLEASARGVTDVNHLCWCRSRSERDRLRLQWAQQQRRSRGTGERIVPLMSGTESGRVSGPDTGTESGTGSGSVSGHSRSRSRST